MSKARRLRILGLILAILPLAGSCAQPGRSSAGGALPSAWAAGHPDLSAEDAAALVARLKALGDRDFMEKAYGLILARDPETAYAYGLSRAYGIAEDSLTDLSDGHALGSRELHVALGREVARRLPSASGDGALALAALSRWLADKARDLELSFDKYPVSPYVNSADQLALDYFTEYRQLRDEEDAERWIACLSGLPAKMKGLATALELRAKAGLVLPRGIYEYTLQGVREIAESPARDSPFYEAFSRRLEAAAIASPASRKVLLDKAAAAIERHALPAWKVLAAALESQAAQVPAEGGASHLPDGAAYYAACLSRLTTTSLSAEEIHELGRKELARVQAEIRARFAALGYPEGAGLSALYDRLGREGGYSSGRELLDRIASCIMDMDGRLGSIVVKRPRIGVEAVLGGMGGYYQPPSADGSRPGRYFVAEGDRRYDYDVATTAYHETLPGHHLQIARALEADLPGFLKGADFLGFTEGWALYAERLAFELGAYAKDPAGDLGRLRMEALRAARLVADTGVNAKGWTFGQACAFLSENTGLGQGMVQADVTRYVIDPGQATAYYTGFLRILALREEAKAALGTHFDLRRFHEALLSHGALPLDVLTKAVEAWVTEEKKS